MSRITAPVSKLTRALSSTSAARAANPLLDTTVHNGGAVLMPKYAELLGNRRGNFEHSDSSRGLTTTHRPTPQPSLANRPKPLMQTFSSSAAPAASLARGTHLDATVLPATSSLEAASSAFSELPRMPLLPDSYGSAHAAEDVPIVSIPSSSIVAANPENVLPATPLSSLEGIGSGLDGVDVRFVHETPAAAASHETEQGMVRDLWKGMVEDIFGTEPTPKRA